MEFHERLRELRRQAGLSLRQLAQSTNYSRSYLSELETGIKRPPPETAERLDEALSAGGGLLALARRRSDGDAPLLDDPEHIDQRRRRVNSLNVDDAILGYLDESVAGLILEYERRPPTMMAPRARHLRGYVDQMLAGRQHPWQRERLYGAAVHLCGLLGALALDLGLPRHARAYGLEAL